MFFLTRKKDNLDSGIYATKDDDGTTVVQFFMKEDDAIMYNTQLGAVGYELEVSQTPDDSVEKICDALGHAYTVVEPGDFVVPRLETLQHVMGDFFK